MITLTVLEIKELAEFAGLQIIKSPFLSEHDLETEIAIAGCPAKGVLNDGESSDSGSLSYYSLVAYFIDCPEEGCIGLGPEIDPPAATAPQGEAEVSDQMIDAACEIY